MNAEQYRGGGVGLAQLLFAIFEPVFAAEDFYNAAQIKQWLGKEIKEGFIGGYRNLEYKEYKAIFDLLVGSGQFYHVGVDFGQQAIHVTLGPSDVYSLYFRNPTVPEW